MCVPIYCSVLIHVALLCIHNTLLASDFSMVKHQLVAFLMFKVYATLTKAGVTPSDVEGLDNCFSGTGSHLFSGLETQYQQMQYFKRHLNLIVSTRCHICIILLAFTW